MTVDIEIHTASVQLVRTGYAAMTAEYTHASLFCDDTLFYKAHNNGRSFRRRVSDAD